MNVLNIAKQSHNQQAYLINYAGMGVLVGEGGGGEASQKLHLYLHTSIKLFRSI